MPEDRLKQLFAEAVPLSSEQQATLVASLRTEDPRLADELLSLLVAHSAAGSFLTKPPEFPLLLHLEDHPSQVGPYRVIRLLARGGMGEVYEAVRDDSGTACRVALKVARPGIFSPELIRRFDRERRTLARLDHPHIARLLDGGTTAEGVPYLAMEFVEGEAIDDFCNHHRYSIDQRLRIFLTVCAAVQYAHGRLVLHRDIKPNNILVTPEGDPKLLDFGIAKVLADEHETPSPDQTRPGAHIFTPEYASPEQVAGNEITTASDVYSLGVMLYVLLTGRRPYDISGAEPQELHAAIHRHDPPSPSSRALISECNEGTDRARKDLKGDLDTIVLTMLEKDPSRRYISVEQCAEDIRRHLSNNPILARPASPGRRIAKFIRRNRLFTGIAATILVGLIAGLAITLHKVREAQAEKERAESINAFLTQVLSYTNPMNPISGTSRTLTSMEAVLDDAARTLESDAFAQQPEVRTQLERLLGEAFGRQGRYDLSYAHFQKYLQLSTELGGDDDPRSLDGLAFRAMELFSKGKIQQSESLFRNILPRMRILVKELQMRPEVLATALNDFGYLRRTQGDSHEAELLFREVLELSPAFSNDSRFVVGVTRATLASVLADQGRFQEAMHMSEEGVISCRREGIAETPDFGFVLTIYGGFLVEDGQFTMADSVLRHAEGIFRRLLAPANLWLGDDLRNQADCLYHQGRWVDAVKKVQEALHIYQESFGTHYDNYPTALTIEGLSFNKLGRKSEAEAILREAVTLRTELLPPGHFFTALAQGALGECLTSQHRFSEAEPLVLQSYNDLLRSQGPDNPRTTLAKTRVRHLYEAWGKAVDILRFRE